MFTTIITITPLVKNRGSFVLVNVCYCKHIEWNNVRIITYNRGGACVVRDRDDRNMLLFGKVGWCLKKRVETSSFIIRPIGMHCQPRGVLF